MFLKLGFNIRWLSFLVCPLNTILYILRDSMFTVNYQPKSIAHIITSNGPNSQMLLLTDKLIDAFMTGSNQKLWALISVNMPDLLEFYKDA